MLYRNPSSINRLTRVSAPLGLASRTAQIEINASISAAETILAAFVDFVARIVAPVELNAETEMGFQVRRHLSPARGDNGINMFRQSTAGALDVRMRAPPGPERDEFDQMAIDRQGLVELEALEDRAYQACMREELSLDALVDTLKKLEEVFRSEEGRAKLAAYHRPR